MFNCIRCQQSLALLLPPHFEQTHQILAEATPLAADLPKQISDIGDPLELVRQLGETQCIDWAKNGEFEGLTGEVGGKRIHKKMQWCLQVETPD